MTQRSFVTILIVICLVCGLGPFSTDMYLPTIPDLAQDMHTSVTTMQLTVSVFFAGLAVGQLFYGPLADAFGRRITLLCGIGIFFCASVIAIFSTSFEMFFVMRLSQALGAASGMVVINAILRDMYEGDRFVRAITITMLTMNVAPLLAPVLGGFIAPFGWRVAFICLSVYAFIVFCAVSILIKETLPQERRQSINLKAVLNNYRRILTNTKTLGALGAQTANGAGLFVFISGSPFVYMKCFGISSEMYGLLFALNVVSIFILTSFNALLVKKFGLLRTLFGALIYSAAGGVILVVCAMLKCDSILSFVLPTIMFICVLGIVGATSTTYILGIFKNMSGTASATLGSLRFAFGSLAGFILNSYPAESPLPLAVAMCFCGIAALVFFWISRLLVRKARDEQR